MAEGKEFEGDFRCEEENCENEEPGTEGYESDDSDADPTYTILEKTRSSLSKLSIKKSKSGRPKKLDFNSDGEAEDEEIIFPELNETDKKSIEHVEKIIQAGQVEKLKVEQCKIYLRKNGLRLTGTKDVLIERIKEHLEIIDGGGEKKYPISSFVLNCKGDACTGDVVMFEQNVYEMYNIASRSATGPPCGTRIVVGRIVKESYGAAKQQHTFTIEVLWSKGVKPLPSLHPLLIKGRNLYRLKTTRQTWADEEKRRKVLLEKHSRGFVARSNREVRIQEKDMKKRLKGQSVMRKETSSTIQESNRHSQVGPIKDSASWQPNIHSQQQQDPVETTVLKEQNTGFQHYKPAIPRYTILTNIHQQTTQPQQKLIESRDSNAREQNTRVPKSSITYCSLNITEQGSNKISEVQNQRNGSSGRFTNPPYHHFSSKDHYQPVARSYDSYQNTNGSQDRYHHRQPLTSLNSYSPQDLQQRSSPLRFANRLYHHLSSKDNQFEAHSYSNANRSSEVFHHRQPLTSLNSYSTRDIPQRQGYIQRQLCRYHAQGKCYYGDKCRYLHELRENM